MKKQKRGGREPVEEIVSLNDELFSLVNGDPLAALEERLAITVGGATQCDVYTCSSYTTCPSLSCGVFRPA